MNAVDTASREESEEWLVPTDRLNESLMLGLRTQDGVNCAVTQQRFGLDARVDRVRAVERLLARGDLVEQGDLLRVPSSRWLRLDGIVAELF